MCRIARPKCSLESFEWISSSAFVPQEHKLVLWKGGCLLRAHTKSNGDMILGERVHQRTLEAYSEILAIAAARAASECGHCPSDEFWNSKQAKDLLKSGGSDDPEAWDRLIEQCRPSEQLSCDGLLARDPQWLDGDEEEFLLSQCSADMCAAYAAGIYTPNHSTISADEMIKHCTSVLSEVEGVDPRSECAQPMPVEERGISIDQQTLSCRDLENERYQSYQRLASWYAFDQDVNDNQIDDRLEDLIDRILQLKSDLSRTRDDPEETLAFARSYYATGLPNTLGSINADPRLLGGFGAQSKEEREIRNGYQTYLSRYGRSDAFGPDCAGRW